MDVDVDKIVPVEDLSEADFKLYNGISTSRSLNTFLIEVRSNVAQSIAENASRYFAVIHFAGKQFKVTNNDLISVKAPLPEVKPGDLIRMEKVLLAGNADFSLVGRPLLPRNNVLVTAMVIEKTLEHPKLWYQFHRRRRHRVMRGKSTLDF